MNEMHHAVKHQRDPTASVQHQQHAAGRASAGGIRDRNSQSGASVSHFSPTYGNKQKQKTNREESSLPRTVKHLGYDLDCAQTDLSWSSLAIGH